MAGGMGRVWALVLFNKIAIIGLIYKYKSNDYSLLISIVGYFTQPCRFNL